MADTTEFASREHGIRLSYPRGWSPAPRGDYVLTLVPSSSSSSRGDTGTSISLDVPELPPHIPGMIPLGMVVNGYVDDLKKKHPNVTIAKPEEATVTGAKARRVSATWKGDDGTPRSEEAVLTVHGDRVYILRSNASEAETRAARQVLDEILASVTWQ